jgi:Domain of unknown function (DUF4333)
VSGPRDPRHPRPEDKTVEVPIRPPAHTDPVPGDEPWWKNANKRVPPPPRMPAPPAAAIPPSPQAQRRDRPPIPARNRHAKAAPPRKRGQVAVLIGVGVIAIAAAVVVLMVALSGFDMLKGKVLNVSKAEAGVQRILLDPDDGYGATNVSDVVCNDGNDPEIRKGASFTCQVFVAGRKRQVLVVFSDDNGTYEVDRPR